MILKVKNKKIVIQYAVFSDWEVFEKVSITVELVVIAVKATINILKTVNSLAALSSIRVNLESSLSYSDLVIS